MRLNLQTDYALRTLIYLAGMPGRAQVKSVADFYGISSHHVAKIVHLLGKGGYVRNIRGVGGGIELARRPTEITVGEIVRTFEPDTHLLACVGQPRMCVIQPACQLRGVLAHAERLQMDYLDSVKLSEVVAPGEHLREFPVVTISLPVKPRPRPASRKNFRRSAVRRSRAR